MDPIKEDSITEVEEPRFTETEIIDAMCISWGG